MADSSIPVEDYQSSPTWRSKDQAQPVVYPSEDDLKSVLAKISTLPPLVSPVEVERLRYQLSNVAQGKAFILQAGDCAELFDYCTPKQIEAKLKLSLLMSLIIIWGARIPVVRIGRIAGQYAKPRSKPTETVTRRDEQGNEYKEEILSYRGDNINAFPPDSKQRTPDPERLLQAYFHSTATLNHIRSSLSSGLADLHAPRQWSFQHVKSSALQQEFESVVDSLTDALDFMRTIGADGGVKEPSVAGQGSVLNSVDYFISHEGLSLEYEEALTRLSHLPYQRSSRRILKGGDRVEQARYALSAHTLWLGDRTRQLDGAHMDYFSSIRNPIGIKVGPSMKPQELVDILDVLNPDVELPSSSEDWEEEEEEEGWEGYEGEYDHGVTKSPSPSQSPSSSTSRSRSSRRRMGKVKGRVMIIIRMGASKISTNLPPLLRAVKESAHSSSVIFLCDPMHGNTVISPSDPSGQLKTRAFGDIISELVSSLEIHSQEGTRLGGVHLELTGDEDVTECYGGSMRLGPEELERNYQSHCDPRLNFEQSLDVAFLLSHYLRKQRLESRRKKSGSKSKGGVAKEMEGDRGRGRERSETVTQANMDGENVVGTEDDGQRLEGVRDEMDRKKKEAMLMGSGDELLAQLICGIRSRR
ncbi:DAHP synthetase [Violaceomyces palustris]|uniref:DAHP synthetase n=1 Tax=Violaceomyces palustris TaxID=1673888 RepID=A0ACD0NLX1_9BASI|nr:DAHP synthetase [Violaceomyces palustris]